MKRVVWEDRGRGLGGGQEGGERGAGERGAGRVKGGGWRVKGVGWEGRCMHDIHVHTTKHMYSGPILLPKLI